MGSRHARMTVAQNPQMRGLTREHSRRSAESPRLFCAVRLAIHRHAEHQHRTGTADRHLAAHDRCRGVVKPHQQHALDVACAGAHAGGQRIHDRRRSAGVCPRPFHRALLGTRRQQAEVQGIERQQERQVDHVQLIRPGLSAAGCELGLSPATVSERLASLESHYGATLMTRTTRSVTLTDEGRILADGARRLLAEADEVCEPDSLGHGENIGPIRLTAPVDLGQHKVVPIIDRFSASHPEVTIDLNLTDSFVDFKSQGYDFAVRFRTGGGQHPQDALTRR